MLFLCSKLDLDSPHVLSLTQVLTLVFRALSIHVMSIHLPHASPSKKEYSTLEADSGSSQVPIV